jgi:hypothetical protein
MRRLSGLDRWAARRVAGDERVEAPPQAVDLEDVTGLIASSGIGMVGGE